MPFRIGNHYLQALRGATTCTNNSEESIQIAVKELITELISRNKLNADDIISITFSATKDLDACFPASIARQHEGLSSVALLDCQQMNVKGDLNFCIRILAQVWLHIDQPPQHPYLNEAQNLRPDR
tara:strand:- start:191 stop:568 length:378 start_codon:yes stop_codon:yes gene_type:complete